MALHVIFAAAYGYSFDWDAKEIWKGHKMAFDESLRYTIDRMITLVLVPRFLLRCLPIKRFQMVNQSYDETKMYFNQLIELEKSGDLSTSAGRTVLSSLVKNSAGMRKVDDPLSEIEIQGNIFLFFIAGHETTYFPLAHC